MSYGSGRRPVGCPKLDKCLHQFMYTNFKTVEPENYELKHFEDVRMIKIAHRITGDHEMASSD